MAVPPKNLFKEREVFMSFIKKTRTRTTRMLFLFVMISVAFGWSSGSAWATDWSDGFPLAKHAFLAQCRAYMVPVDVPSVGAAEVYGELCVPRGSTPETVQLLVHGTSYNHNYWDWPYRPDKYSHVLVALKNGYATFNIDRLGTGLSSKPNSSLVTVDAVVESMHQIVSKLRNGEIGRQSFSKVVYFGSSLSTALGWLLGSSHPEDIDFFVMTGLIHFTTQHFFNWVLQFHLDPACQDPKFKNWDIDCGYITTHPGTKGLFYLYEPNIDPINILLDEALKDIASPVLTLGTAVYVGVDAIHGTTVPVEPEGAPSRDIKVPTLVLFGEFDETGCGSDGFVCTDENIYNFEAPFYSPEAQLEVHVIKNTGHALTIHFSAPETANLTHDWLARKLAPH
jgi:pimeloyl-ACP methyl ester carboxylesterase